MDLREIIELHKTIAVVGMSASPYKPSHSVPKYFHSLGWKIIPVNPTADEILGLKVYRNIMEVPEEIDMVNVFRPSEDALEVVKDAIKRKDEKGDIKAIWLQEGISNSDARQLALDAGLIYVEDRCMYKEY